ncbi:hypothetical protein ACH4ZU_37125 [Streptomyces sp. NPDC020472]|uniref:hypothetical protein n=1 Tax=Streptomyces sp. NPDC020472 TaxID=3365075 RepID=UPI0037A27BD6
MPLGYQGSYQRVRAYFRCFREKRLAPGAVTARPPSPRVVAGWILGRPETLTETEHLRLKAILVHCPELEALTGHVRSFGQMLTERQGERLPQWLDAVIAGLTLPCDSGVVEGHTPPASQAGTGLASTGPPNSHTAPGTAIEMMGRQRRFTVAALSDQSQFTGEYCFFSAVRSRP